MFVYEKKLQYPVKIKNCNPKLAAVIISQYGGAYFNRLQKRTPIPYWHPFPMESATDLQATNRPRIQIADSFAQVLQNVPSVV